MVGSGRTHFLLLTFGFGFGRTRSINSLTLPPRFAREAPSCLRLVVQLSAEISLSCSSELSFCQRLWATSVPRRLISSAPKSTVHIGVPCKRSLLVISTRPRISTKAPQAPSRGRLSSVVNSGRSSTARPNSRESSPIRVASMIGTTV